MGGGLKTNSLITQFFLLYCHWSWVPNGRTTSIWPTFSCPAFSFPIWLLHSSTNRGYGWDLWESRWLLPAGAKNAPTYRYLYFTHNNLCCHIYCNKVKCVLLVLLGHPFPLPFDTGASVHTWLQNWEALEPHPLIGGLFSLPLASVTCGCPLPFTFGVLLPLVACEVLMFLKILSLLPFFFS